MSKWELNHSGNVILVKNSVAGEKLFVNGELQDERNGLSLRSRLYGNLPNDENIKVSLGGWFSTQCRIFVDHKLISPK